MTKKSLLYAEDPEMYKNMKKKDLDMREVKKKKKKLLTSEG